jgi:ribosome maturation factor RimP
MDLEQRIGAMIAPSLVAMGYDLVRVMLQGRQRPVLQIMAERRDNRAMTVEDCADISRQVSALLDVEDPIAGAYSLEVSSPGIDRPLTRPSDYERFVGFEAKLETDQPIDGRKRFRGRLMGVDGQGQVTVKADDAEWLIPLSAVKTAKLVLTDDLIAAAQQQTQQ